MPQEFSKTSPDKLREYQKKAAAKRSDNYLIKCRTAVALFDKYDNIRTVMSVLNVGREAAYRMVKKGKELDSRV